MSETKLHRLAVSADGRTYYLCEHEGALWPLADKVATHTVADVGDDGHGGMFIRLCILWELAPRYHGMVIPIAR